jgi:hypothetical protein
MIKGATSLAVLGCALALAIPSAQAAKYKEADVADGGSISGKVLIGSAKPEAQIFKITKDEEVCGTGDREVAWVRANGEALLDAVVYLEDVDAGKPFPDDAKTVMIDQKNCTFLPFMAAMANEGELEAVNSDPVTHNIHTYEIMGKRGRRTAINVSQSEQGSKIKKKIKLRKGNAMKVECDVHNFMHAWVFVAKNPYYAMVDENGAFTIDGVPPGTYTVKSWHGRLGEQEVTVEVAAGGAAEASLSY